MSTIASELFQENGRFECKPEYPPLLPRRLHHLAHLHECLESCGAPTCWVLISPRRAPRIETGQAPFLQGSHSGRGACIGHPGLLASQGVQLFCTRSQKAASGNFLCGRGIRGTVGAVQVLGAEQSVENGLTLDVHAFESELLHHWRATEVEDDCVLCHQRACLLAGSVCRTI